MCASEDRLFSLTLSCLLLVSFNVENLGVFKCLFMPKFITNASE